MKYKCMLCGWTYDPEKGDPSKGIEPGTAWEDLPDDWKCPLCGAGKDMFEAVAARDIFKSLHLFQSLIFF